MVSTNRRRFLKAVSVSSLSFAAGCMLPPSTSHPVSESVASWPSFRGGQHNTGFAKGVSPTSSDPSIAWEFDADGPFWGSPTVEDGTVYTGCADNSVYAIDAETGEERWRFETDHRVEGTPAYADGTVYIGSYDRHVYAIDAEAGEERWERETKGLIRGSPTVFEDSVFIGAGCHNLACSWYAEDSNTSKDGAVYCLDANSGEVNWRHDVEDEVVSTPAVDRETVFIGSSDETMYALDASDGTVTWTYEVDDMIWSSPAVAYGTVYFGDWDGLIHAVDAVDGEGVWTFDTDSLYISSSLAVDEDSVYVGDTPANYPEPGENSYAELFALDRRSGEERWRFETDSLEIGSSPVVTDDRLYLGIHQQHDKDSNGVYSFTTDGDLEWSMYIGTRGVGASPALVDGTLYFGGTDGVVYAVE